LRSELPAVAAAAEAVAARLRDGGRLLYVGAGTSGRLGVLDAVECGPTFGTSPGQVEGLIAGGAAALQQAVEGVEDDAARGAADLAARRLTAADAVVGIAASGSTPYVLGAVSHARQAGALTVGVSCNAGSPLAAACDLAITPVVGPEVLTGSTRLKAGTATKLVCNMLSTAAMVRLGKAYSNLMVDLRAHNSKLRARALRVVGAATGLDDAAAAALLERCGGEVKTALVAHRRSVPVQRARELLAAAGGIVRRALGEAGPGERARAELPGREGAPSERE
jgi:N-acetylmuramic acid 6-phosphate etherase